MKKSEIKDKLKKIFSTILNYPLIKLLMTLILKTPTFGIL